MFEVPGYRIERELGRGGMANVYLATQESLARPVALKVLAPHLTRDPTFVQRFVREGRIAAGVRHRHIVPIFDVGTYADGAFMALAWMPRGSLGQRVFPLSPIEAERMLREIAGALAHAHRAGVVHRDVKPENILIDDDDAFVLTDFGIAQIANSSQTLTAEGTTIGTPAYMAPEQWRGSEIDGRADLYSLGVVFYQCLTGRVPYSGTDGWSIGMQHMQAPLPMLPAVHAHWQPLLDRLLAKLPEQRFGDAQALLRALDELPARLPGAGVATTGLSTPKGAAALFQTAPQSPAVPMSRARFAHWKKSRPWPLPPWQVLLAVAVIGRGALGWWASAPDSRLRSLLAGDPSVATLLVLPCSSFANLSAHHELGDTLAQALVHRLSRLRDLTVISPSTLLDSGNERAPLQIANGVGATHLLACSIRRAPEGVRIGAELVETARGTVRWSADFERSSEDLLEIVDDLALGIADRLLDQLAGPERASLMRHRASSLDAVTAVAQGLALLATAGIVELAAARAKIDTGIGFDPGYAAGPLALAEAFSVEDRLRGHDLAWLSERALPLIEAALQLDPDAASAYVQRGRLRCADYDWAGCLDDLERALSLEPGAAEVQALASEVYLQIGPGSRALAAARRWTRSAPDSTAAWTALAAAFLQDERARAAFDLTVEVSTRGVASAPLWLVRADALRQLGQCDDGLAALEQARTLSSRATGLEASTADLLGCAGRSDQLQEWRRQQETKIAVGDPIDASTLVTLQLLVGNRAAALDALELMYRTRDPLLIAWLRQPQHGIHALAGDARFRGVLDRVQLPASGRSSQPASP